MPMPLNHWRFTALAASPSVSTTVSPDRQETTTPGFDLHLLESRYQQELRPYLIGPVEKHDLTLKRWLDAIREGR